MKKITKRIKGIISLVLILVVLAVGIFTIPVRRIPAPISLWEQNQLVKAIGEGSFNKSEWTDLHDDPTGRNYFGKFNGYYVVSTEKMTCDIRVEKISDYTFYFNSYTIGVWKDGVRMDLSYAYEQGKISGEDVAKIYKYHIQIEEIMKKFMEERYT